MKADVYLGKKWIEQQREFDVIPGIGDAILVDGRTCKVKAIEPPGENDPSPLKIKVTCGTVKVF